MAPWTWLRRCLGGHGAGQSGDEEDTAQKTCGAAFDLPAARENILGRLAQLAASAGATG